MKSLLVYFVSHLNNKHSYILCVCIHTRSVTRHRRDFCFAYSQPPMVRPLLFDFPLSEVSGLNIGCDDDVDGCESGFMVSFFGASFFLSTSACLSFSPSFGTSTVASFVFSSFNSTVSAVWSVTSAWVTTVVGITMAVVVVSAGADLVSATLESSFGTSASAVDWFSSFGSSSIIDDFIYDFNNATCQNNRLHQYHAFE